MLMTLSYRIVWDALLTGLFLQVKDARLVRIKNSLIQLYRDAKNVPSEENIVNNLWLVSVLKKRLSWLKPAASNVSSPNISTTTMRNVKIAPKTPYMTWTRKDVCHVPVESQYSMDNNVHSVLETNIITKRNYNVYPVGLVDCLTVKNKLVFARRIHSGLKHHAYLATIPSISIIRTKNAKTVRRTMYTSCTRKDACLALIMSPFTMEHNACNAPRITFLTTN